MGYYNTTMSKFARRLQQSPPKGAKLYITPASGSLTNGNTLVITIREDSGSDPVNAVQASLTYPTARLQFQSISTASSPFTTTAQATGGSGSVDIGVALLGDSVTGNNIVATVTFTIISTGSAAITFDPESGIARSTDSVDICKQKLGANYTIS